MHQLTGGCGMNKLLFSNKRTNKRTELAGLTRRRARVPLVVAFSKR